jgi:flagellar biosynthesis/type III secretory pathway protein FliH
LGRVVKNARLGAQKYQVSVPAVALNGSLDPGHLFAGRHAQQPDTQELDFRPLEPAPPPIDEIAVHARAMVDDAEERATALLADAHDRARQLIEDAAQRGAEIVETIQAQAHADGFTAGTEQANREMSDMMATMHNLVDMARAERHKLIESAEPELVRLAMGIAERILHQQIALDRGVVVEMAKVAIARLVDRESVTVRVNPADLERMRQHRDEFLNASDIKHLRFVEDQRVDRGGVVVETDGGTIDARISTQLAEAKRVLHVEYDEIVQPADATESNLRAVRAS